MSRRRPPALQWRHYEQRNDLAKARASDRLRILDEVDALVGAGMTKSGAVNALAKLKEASAASIWSWLRSVADVQPGDRLAYLVPAFRGGGRDADIDGDLLESIATDYLRPERPSWTACVRRLEAIAMERGAALPHAKTLWRRLHRDYGAPLIALRRGELVRPGSSARMPANDR